MIFESRYDIGQNVMVPEPDLSRIVGGEITYTKVKIVGVSWSCVGEMISHDAARITYQTDYLSHDGKRVIYHVNEEDIQVLQ